jgi:hypothetical protein
MPDYSHVFSDDCIRVQALVLDAAQATLPDDAFFGTKLTRGKQRLVAGAGNRPFLILPSRRTDPRPKKAKVAPSSLFPEPPPAQPSPVQLFARDWSYNEGARFVKVENGHRFHAQAGHRCLGFLCRYRINSSQPWATANVGTLLVLDCSTPADARLVASHDGFRLGDKGRAF